MKIKILEFLFNLMIFMLGVVIMFSSCGMLYKCIIYEPNPLLIIICIEGIIVGIMIVSIVVDYTWNNSS